MTVSDLALIAQADIWFEVYDGEGNLIVEGDYQALSDIDNVIVDFWINDEGTLCMHIEGN